jgi:hypothetical protein
MRALFRAANAKAKAFLEQPKDPYAGWTEVARVSLVQCQLCRACGESPVHIVGEFLKLSGYAPRGDGIPPLRTEVLVRRPSLRADLPLQIQHLQPETVALCVGCINGSERVDKVIDCVTKKPLYQLRLFS